ncbi:MAG TPA: hypothetical protein VKR53_15885 [Puia sp.]|nr:hypothetical protein [Puia sp.]
MKWSTRILLSMAVLLVAGMLASNIILKKVYDKVDKNDSYWTFDKVLDQHFKYLKITGGNITQIGFEQSPNCSVRISNDWRHGHEKEKLFTASVSNDTLCIRFTFVSQDEGERFWMKRTTLVRIFSPELLYVEEFNSNFEMYKLKQKNIDVNISGRSNFEMESFIRDLDTLHITQKDTSEVVFEMSPEYKPSLSKEDKMVSMLKSIPGLGRITTNESMTIASLTADLQGSSLLDVGHAQIGSTRLAIADSSAIIFSGGALRAYCK